MTQPVGIPVIVDYGTDFDCPGDLNPALVLVTGRVVLAQALFRRLICPRKKLFYAPNYGLGIQQWLNDGLRGIGDVARRANQIDAECRKDERVLLSQTTGLFTPVRGNAGVLTFTTRVTDGKGAFPLVLSINDVANNVTLLSPTPAAA
jgi:hypothetical protein